MKPKYTCLWYSQSHLDRWKCVIHQGYRQGHRLTLALPCNKARRPSKQREAIYLRALQKHEAQCKAWNEFARQRELNERS